MLKTFSIKEVAKKFDLSISTIRYYDKRGLLPFVAKNAAGYRIFTETDLNLIKTIVCLKNTGMSINNIKTYIELVMAGPSSIDERKKLLLNHRRQVLQEQQVLADNLREVDFKIKKYESPDAESVIKNELEYVAREKKKLNL
ncbi:MerR family transcriptional regulator [Companilactobacillus baiquanensis]|uniref:MerR family transcriptional regulator n=1 Tax=Companilactobacillus baiquanensis TaxID=2486005 RepID=A0ABW1UWE4_9LACO|nr:MerR family transcriptional regulator [Companilactobacillus baiquanensis]